jgi:hypothetical protein
VDTTIQTQCKDHRRLLRHRLFLFLTNTIQILSLLKNVTIRKQAISLYITHASTFDKSSRISHKVQEKFLSICGTKPWYKCTRFSTNPTQRLYTSKPVKRIFLLQIIANYDHPRHTATNCGKCTVVLYRGFTVNFRLHNLRVKNLRTWKVPVVENLSKRVKEHRYCSVINQQGTAVNEHEMGP